MIAFDKYFSAQTDGIAVNKWNGGAIRRAIRQAWQHINRRDSRRQAEEMSNRTNYSTSVEMLKTLG